MKYSFPEQSITKVKETWLLAFYSKWNISNLFHDIPCFSAFKCPDVQHSELSVLDVLFPSRFQRERQHRPLQRQPRRLPTMLGANPSRGAGWGTDQSAAQRRLQMKGTMVKRCVRGQSGRLWLPRRPCRGGVMHLTGVPSDERRRSRGWEGGGPCFLWTEITLSATEHQRQRPVRQIMTSQWNTA